MSTRLVTDVRAYMEEELQISFNLLFSESPDFRQACRCDECRHKITMLEEFESEIKWKKRLVGRYNLELDNIQLHCSSLRSAVGWTQGMLDLLYKHLEEVYQKSGAKFSRKRSRSDDLMGDMYYELVEMHGSCNLIDEHFENITTVVGKPSLDPIGPEIHYGFIKYEITAVKDKAFAILQQMAKLDDEMEKKGAEEGLDHSISKHYLEEQIKLVMELPAREVCEEATNIIPVALSVPYKRLLVREASTFIFGTSRDIIRERDSFWQQFLKRPSSGESKEHVSNGLNQTLHSLLQKVQDFKDHWEEKYAAIIGA
ncbi:GMP synthase [glutamine-hydrolyzing] [Striga asiatica]|uniref:GMP synthase [glutamine-hydrolyzing] n=1 Tax=Striga asiatica TaxID=4170 RepID=A0A5A7QNY2_STRAF|nr:GMP synthase [glutamine-hydrolyzing] [Striga asiatica]